MDWKNNVFSVSKLGTSVIDTIPRGNIKLEYLKWQIALIWAKKNISQGFYYSGRLENGIVLIDFRIVGDEKPFANFGYSLEEGDGKFEKALARGFVKWLAITYGFGFDLHLKGSSNIAKTLIDLIED